MGPWLGVVIYGTLAVIVAGVFLIVLFRRKKAKKRYAALAEQWNREGYRRVAVSPAGAVLFCDREKRSLIVARENTDRFAALSFAEICGFSLYDDDVLLLSGNVGEAVQKGDSRTAAKKAKRQKSECLRLTLRRADGETDVMVLTDERMLRESREYDEARKMADRFADVMLEVKAEIERERRLSPPEESEWPQKDEPGVEARLLQLRDLRDKWLISKEQYTARSTEIIKNI